MATTTAKARRAKFSVLEDDSVYVELEKFVRYLAGRNANPNNTMMEYDEIVGELMLEMVKGIRAYPDLPMNQLKAVIRRMMDNRIGELRYRFYTTHRSAENKMISLSILVNVNDEDQLSYNTPTGIQHPVEELIEDEGADPSTLLDSKERVQETRENLSLTALRVFDAVIYGNNMLAKILLLSSMRASYVFGSRTTVMKPWHIADALHLSLEEVKGAIKEIKYVYAEVCNA
jgi:hypothetical protein